MSCEASVFGDAVDFEWSAEGALAQRGQDEIAWFVFGEEEFHSVALRVCDALARCDEAKAEVEIVELQQPYLSLDSAIASPGDEISLSLRAGAQGSLAWELWVYYDPVVLRFESDDGGNEQASDCKGVSICNSSLKHDAIFVTGIAQTASESMVLADLRFTVLQQAGSIVTLSLDPVKFNDEEDSPLNPVVIDAAVAVRD